METFELVDHVQRALQDTDAYCAPKPWASPTVFFAANLLTRLGGVDLDSELYRLAAEARRELATMTSVQVLVKR